MENTNLLKNFLDTKKLEGCSDATIKQYDFNIGKMITEVDKEIKDITTQDIRNYLADYKNTHNVSNVTLDNMRRNYNSFFSWLHAEGLINSNPCNAVNKIKTDKIIKMGFTEEEMEILRDNCKNLRETAIIEVLYSTGMRIGELAKLNKNDINWLDKSVIVFGKGSKERPVYLNVKAKRA